MKKTVMYTNDKGISYYRIGCTYYSNNGWFKKVITKEEYEKEIANIDDNNIVEAPRYVDLRFDYRELKKEIESQYKSVSEFARVIGIPNTLLWRKLENRTEFTTSEIFIIMYKLNLTNLKKYFFTPLELEVEDEC